jgi:hypothetical protein
MFLEVGTQQVFAIEFINDFEGLCSIIHDAKQVQVGFTDVVGIAS